MAYVIKTFLSLSLCKETAHEFIFKVFFVVAFMLIVDYSKPDYLLTGRLLEVVMFSNHFEGLYSRGMLQPYHAFMFRPFGG